jgi:solute carrier family 13 (sodium-dependent dicarboxylate transporter), member 2/3/5
LTPTTQLKLPHLFPLFLGPLLAFMAWSLPLALSVEAQRCAGVLIWVGVWWLCPLIPLHVSGFFGIILAHFLGLAPWRDIITSYADPIIFLFMGGFFLARACQHHRLDQWLVQATLAHPRIKGNNQRLFIALTCLTALLSAFLSNTATATLVIPIGLEILRRCDDKGTGKLILLLAAASSIGGIMTPVGGIPNMIALGLMDKILGHRPDFLTWMIHMVPLGLSILFGVLLIFKKELSLLPTQEGIKTIKKPMTVEQKLISFVLWLTGLLWILPSLLKLSTYPPLLEMAHLLNESVVSMMGAILLMLIPTKDGPLLPWEEAKKIDWGVLLLFGSGLALGTLGFKTGLAGIMAQAIDSLSYLTASQLIIFAIIGTIFLTEFASNTATANLIVPILLATPLFLDGPERIIYATVAAANLAFMLPVGTPPNAIAYATGLVDLFTMIKKGFMSNIVAIILISLFSLIFF